jgi:rhodanese-related sulfurtransferase
MADQQLTDQELTPSQVAELGEAQLVDVRTTPEHEAGHLAGSRHVQLDQVHRLADDLDRDRPVVFYCRVGERSALAAEAFRAAGWDAYTMAGGLMAWADEGRPLEPEGGTVAQHSSIPDF